MRALHRPPNHAPLAALRYLALDLETTGFDPKRDRIVQVGAIALEGARIAAALRLELLVNPGVPIPEASSRIHGLRDADVAGAPRFAECVAALQEAMAGRVIVGHYAAFDLAFLRHEAARAGIVWRDPPCLDVALLAGALEPSLREPDLETLAERLGVSIRNRHTAAGDALAAAELFARLLPKLREAEVRTLGEALAFASRRGDLVQRQAEAGWLPAAVPGAGTAPPARIDSYVFERSLRDVMSRPPLMIPATATLRQAAQRMAEARVGALLVGEAGAPAQGIFTERDLLRAAARGEPGPDAATVRDAMSAPVESMQADEMLYRALGRMDRLGIRHLCVVDPHGVALGMISQRDLLRHRARATLALGDALASAGDAMALAAAYGQVPDAAARLVAEGVGGAEIARVVSCELRALTACAARIAETQLRGEQGEAPAPWCLMVLGSGGRGESLLGADQDNALIHLGGAEADAWFARFGERIADLLHEAGVPRCAGGVMAANAEWRGSPPAWRQRVENWLRRARPEDLLNVDIFFDLVAVAGDASLAAELHDEAVHAAGRAPPFLALLAQSVASGTPLLGMFGRLRVENGRSDLKRYGLLPLVGAARTLALRAGSGARATPDRLLDAAAAGCLSQGDATTLIEVHARLMDLVLQQQLADIDAGVRPSGRVAPAEMERGEGRRIAKGLRALEQIVEALPEAVAR
jgi:DNA polymerase-3 subunit epsilon/CBS domain-containing protein